MVVFDEYTYKYYQETSKTWLKGRSNKLAHVTIASIGGGHMDYLVQTDSVASWDVDVHTVVCYDHELLLFLFYCLRMSGLNITLCLFFTCSPHQCQQCGAQLTI